MGMTDTERLAIIETKTNLRAGSWYTRFKIRCEVRRAMTNGQFIIYSREAEPVR